MQQVLMAKGTEGVYEFNGEMYDEVNGSLRAYVKEKYNIKLNIIEETIDTDKRVTAFATGGFVFRQAGMVEEYKKIGTCNLGVDELVVIISKKNKNVNTTISEVLKTLGYRDAKVKRVLDVSESPANLKG